MPVLGLAEMSQDSAPSRGIHSRCGRSGTAAAGADGMRLEGVGEVREHGEWWALIYDCGHETWFDRVAHRLFEPADVQRVVLKVLRCAV
jgi:hypothetical protein